MADPSIASGDTLKNAINAALAELSARITNFDGAQIDSGSVANVSLALGKSLFVVALNTDLDWFKGTGVGGAAKTGVWSVKLPNVDGASNSSWALVAASIGFQEFTTIHAAGATLDIKENGTTKLSIGLNNVTAAATPYVAYPGAAESSASGDTWRVDYTPAATGDTQYPTLVLYFTLKHVGT